MDKSEIVNYFLERGILVSPDFIEMSIDNSDFSFLCDKFEKKDKLIILDSDIISSSNVQKNNYTTQTLSVPKYELSKIKSIEESKYNVEVIYSYDKEVKKMGVKDFVGCFKSRYNSIKKILSSRQELQDSLSIVRLTKKQAGEIVSIIGLVMNKAETKNGNFRLTLEDTTGVFDVIITKTNEEVYNIAKDLVLDEVIGVTGRIGDNILFCKNIYFPDIPLSHEFKKSPDEVYAVFISDIHFGIKNFLEGDFMKFIKWLRGEYGNEKQRAIVSKVGYLFITGDIVEGVGIYPGQEEDLKIKDIYKQYEEATKYFKMIPERIKIIICGGNHDAMRIAEPQPAFDKNISKGFYEIPNMIIVSNPAIVNIHSSEDFPGFNVLMYHGFSFPYYGNNVPSIIEKGGIFRCDLIMKFLLQRRHLAPSHSSTLYIPDESCDPLVISKVPDIFVSGHIHQITIDNYRNVTMINSSCWVTQSDDNARRGIVPHPGKIPIINLKTREVKIMNFLDEDAKVLLSERMGLR